MAWEAGGGQVPRQPGQVRKEAAVTSFGLGRRSVSHRFTPARTCRRSIERAGRPPTACSRANTGPATFAELIGQEAMVRTLTNAIATGRIAARLHPHRRARRRQDHHRPHHRPRAQLHRPRRQGRPDRRALRRVRALPRHRRGPPCRRDGDGRRLAHRRRRHPRADRRRALQPGRGALQDLHHRRSAHAVEERLQRAVEDARRAAARRQIHLRHHRDPQGAGDGAVALPALLAAPRAGRACWPRITRRSPRRRASRPSRRRSR